MKNEITIKALIIGIILSIILASANAYLGLFAGMTVSASIPAAVISMAILSFFKRSNILENNIIQTAASAGESLAAGVIFTIPALVLMGYWKDFHWFEIAKISGLGGIIGVLFTIPLRRALIIEAKLKYPEGIATAEVLHAGCDARDKGASKVGLIPIVTGSLAGGLMKLAHQGFGLWSDSIQGAKAFAGMLFAGGCAISPALLAVGYIVGLNIAFLVLLGGLISWLVAIPIYSVFIGLDDFSIAAASEIWNAKIRYMGVGAMVVGGVAAIFSLVKPIISSFKIALSHDKKELVADLKDIPLKWVLILLLFSIVPLFFVCYGMINSVWIALFLSVIMVVFGFVFSAVAGYMAGLVGSSNNPISGVTIATVLLTSLLLLVLVGSGQPSTAAAAIMIGAVVCCASAIAGDNMQDLKAGHLVGATPWKQQIMQMVGTIAAALTMGITLNILDSAYTIGSPTLSAPQATLMLSVAKGVLEGGLPWNFVYIGAVIGIIIIIANFIVTKMKLPFKLHILAIAVGIYLPITLSVAIFIGGLVAYLAARQFKTKVINRKALLFASGLITGEALMGILVALPIFLTANKYWWYKIDAPINWLGALIFILITIGLFAIANNKKNNLL